MNEQEFFKKMIHDRAVNDAVVKARAKRETRKPFVWKKAVAIAAGCAAVLIAVVFTIPSARAEVLSWFGVSTPQDYLTVDPDERTEIPEIDALISSPAPENGVKVLPIDRTDSKAVNSEGALKLSDFFYENCDVALGDAMFDGQYFYQTVRMNGLSGLYLLEEWTGGNQTGVKVDPYAVWGLYENGPDEEYLTGKWTLYEHPMGRIFYELPDGTRLVGMLDLSGALDAYYDSLYDQGLIGENASTDAQEKIDAQNLQFLEKNGVTAVASIWAQDGTTDLADENGNLSVKVLYEVTVCEEDRGDGNWVPNTELFKAELGTITVNVRARENLETSRLESADGAVKWGAETVTVSKVDIDFGEPDDGYADDRIAFSKYRVSTEGMTMTAENAKVDALGIHDLEIRIDVPDAWTQNEREALAASIGFKVLINGECGDWYISSNGCNVTEDGSVLFLIGSIAEIPYDMLKSIQTITLVPRIQTIESIGLLSGDNRPLGTLDPEYGETVWSERGINGWNHDEDRIEFPQYAIVLHVN